MTSRSAKWACAAFGLMLAVGVLPTLASAQGTVESGTATQAPPDGDQSGRGQVRITGTFACDSDLALNTCFLFIGKILFEASELVHAERCLFDGVGDPLAISPRSGSKSNDAVYEVDRAVIDTPSESPVSLETAFLLDCAGSAAFDASACWRSSVNGPGNWRAPR